jgi:TolA-binding protein
MCLTQIYTARVGIRVYMSNRVEDLERQVAELQAAVNGLTEELVEMKERVRQVEDAQEVPVTAAGAGDESGGAVATGEESTETTDAAGGETRTHSDDHVEVVEQTGNDTDAKRGGTGDGDDMVVPEQEATTPDAEAGESEGEGDDEESDSDIIVA